MNAGVLITRFAAEMRRSRSIKICGGILIAIAVLSLIGPWISPHSYLSTNFDGRFIEPGLSGYHLFGTDDLGRDLFVRTLMGVQVTLLVAIVASVVSLVIGVAVPSLTCTWTS